MKVLLVEDDDRLGAMTKNLLEYEQIAVDWAQDGQEAIDYIKDNLHGCYDVVILDWMLPNLSGLEICKILREKYGFSGGIVFVTAKSDEDDCVLALNSGADDYVVKPFKIKELVARIQAVNRRKGKPFVDVSYTRDDITLNRETKQVLAQGREISLRNKEFLLFELLFVNMGQIIPRETIFEKIWRDQLETNPETLDAHIYSLRKKLKEHLPQLQIRLVKNVGYVLEKCQ